MKLHIPADRPRYTGEIYVDLDRHGISHIMTRTKGMLGAVRAPKQDISDYESACMHAQLEGVLVTTATLFRLLDVSLRYDFVYN